ncbi:uncharacterized protein FOMMEDRAFT_127734 [Fomitiporia mediterranea MF3/22]|uniref:uncharacterized protein n=1 Tax=Fomitiporia mediterranea (strain MF3/22) TaxID=694068 RepID=UPI0004408B65|nr:uncharacterized protein FOMMEDRAFT_127734 [Fomitiporia mediterranea MF3/22]EJD00245.1 hypothetical protein FOMMEDRAFT_127734 [Fomitiporia mediterranea MF3/22]
MSVTLLDLPPEIIESILLFAGPIDTARFSQTCRALYSLVYESEDQHLWRALFLAEETFDDPRKCTNSFGDPLLHYEEPVDWQDELKRRVRAQTVISNPACFRNNDELLQVLETVVSMVIQTPSASYQYTSEEISRNLVWLAARRELGDFLEYFRARRNSLLHEIRQLVAKLHTHVGHTAPDFSLERCVDTRAFVYDMRNYSEANGWGPFQSNGEVNWEHLLAVQHVMGMHIVAPEDASPVGNQVLSLLPYCQTQLPKHQLEGDWAGVDGLWSCSFCFIDHRELLAFNVTDPRDTSLFARPDFIEVFRSFRLRMRFTGTKFNPKFPTRPTITFKGSVQDVHTMTGTVNAAGDGTIRWSFTSGEATQMIWSSEGVQIGAAQSTFGVLGTWTTVFHDEGDPVGKLSSRFFAEEKSNIWNSRTVLVAEGGT